VNEGEPTGAAEPALPAAAALPGDAKPVDVVIDTSKRDQDACCVLRTAGYRAHVARLAVQAAIPHVGAAAPLEVLIREAFRRCGCAAQVRGTDTSIR
jgi:hypothetical protein